MNYDAIVVGSGPNGLAAAITFARASLRVLLIEGAETVGGSTRSAEITLPGFTHDICAAVLALAGVSPFLSSAPLSKFGLELVEPPVAFAHPLDDGTAAVVQRSPQATADALGSDGAAYLRLLEPFLHDLTGVFSDVLGPPRIPRHPRRMARFAIRGLHSARSLAEHRFESRAARALFAGVCAHATVPLEWAATSAFGLILTLAAHATGWPIARGGSQGLANALANYLKSLGGEIRTGTTISDLRQLPEARVLLCDLTPRQLIGIAGDRLPHNYRRRLENYQYGPGAFKMDFALNGPIPWKSSICREAGTVHLGGTLNEISQAEEAPWQNRHADHPYVLVVQPSLFDPTRAPPGKQTAWAYCHVPNGSGFDMSSRIEAQIERFAPGFSDVVLARHVMNPAALQRHNPNLIGGDISGGASNLAQLFTRPIASLNPYATPVKGLYLCSSSTPPGAGVHGMCGYFAAREALRHCFRIQVKPLATADGC